VSLEGSRILFSGGPVLSMSRRHRVMDAGTAMPFRFQGSPRLRSCSSSGKVHCQTRLQAGLSPRPEGRGKLINSAGHFPSGS